MAFKMSQECLTVSLDITCCPGSQETLSLILMTKIRCQSLHYIVSAVSASLNNVIFEPWIFFLSRLIFLKLVRVGQEVGLTHSVESVAQRKSTHSQKPKLSTIKPDHQMDG